MRVTSNDRDGPWRECMQQGPALDGYDVAKERVWVEANPLESVCTLGKGSPRAVHWEVG